ncbi:sensor histidine kinase [Chitinimonas sp.]|uniref:sensor histidine kinase n=1 Tax=Chitinimonas sp. TaxID=1934313 RepID=UPI0035B45BEA
MTRPDFDTRYRSPLWRNLLITLAINTAISVWYAHITQSPLWRILLTFHLLGLALLAGITAIFAIAKPSPRREPYYMAGAVLGSSVLGVLFNWLLRIDDWINAVREAPERLLLHLLVSLAVTTMISAIVASILWGREKAGRMAAAYQAEQAKNAEQARRLMQAQLRMLQAQIEPHFLFNTLANVQSLIDVSPSLAKQMLGLFNDYLRASLARTRNDIGTVGEECSLLRAYLGILKIRMDSRLQFRIDCPGDLQACPLPPMLLQPLVENAIQHGLEPKVEGGAVSVSVSRTGQWLRLEVSDNGLGLPATVSSHGVGLSNVRERLASLYEGKARFELLGQAGGGTLARLEIPLPDQASQPMAH